MGRDMIKNTESDYEREKMQERLAKLCGGVAVIKVGGASDVEVQEKKDRVTDSLNATRAAVQEGIVPGGGAALLYACAKVHTLLTDSSLTEDQKLGVRIVEKAIKLPCSLIAQNAGKEGAVIIDKLLSQDNKSLGYDARTHNFVDMYEAGIIDPTKVVKTALQDAASIAGLMITTEAAITDIPQPPAPPAAGGGDMGGGMF
eukprot:NODE_454_length_883_cov_121.549161_g398_i0.p1 GENE.NODE_454_length_883_cov_121.549161_g398_i0~~NODE_454_length_883_cov_121.549161_g398_i0.p1  ORF type:complete len:209 (-),score=89.06 NODE_454_length_883_cov_121.549161_g398_i0:257-859(-)